MHVHAKDILETDRVCAKTLKVVYVLLVVDCYQLINMLIFVKQIVYIHLQYYLCHKYYLPTRLPAMAVYEVAVFYSYFTVCIKVNIF